MGYSFNSIQKILADRHFFVGKTILTLGTLYPFLSGGEQKRLAELGIDFTVTKEKFSKQLFVDFIGAACCHSIDVSDYQGADIICNLNHPIPDRYASCYDVVIDAGTLEHLGNLSTALANIFNLLRKGGIYYFGVPCNNWVDHGFFQFSPTFFRDICIDNQGLELVSFHLGTKNKYYEYAEQNPAFIQALRSSRKPLNVGGIIRKCDDGIHLDLTQSKYRSLHNHSTDHQAALETATPRRGHLVTAVLQSFITSSWVPLLVKENILNLLYRLKKRSSSQSAT
jgi:hypothetical protein